MAIQLEQRYDDDTTLASAAAVATGDPAAGGQFSGVTNDDGLKAKHALATDGATSDQISAAEQTLAEGGLATPGEEKKSADDNASMAPEVTVDTVGASVQAGDTIASFSLDMANSLYSALPTWVVEDFGQDLGITFTSMAEDNAKSKEAENHEAKEAAINAALHLTGDFHLAHEIGTNVGFDLRAMPLGSAQSLKASLARFHSDELHELIEEAGGFDCKVCYDPDYDYDGENLVADYTPDESEMDGCGQSYC